jgi:hypothetical protein
MARQQCRFMTLAFVLVFLSAIMRPSQAADGAADLVPQVVGYAPGPRLWVTPLVLDFGPVGLGTTSPTQVVTITNTGSQPLDNFAGGAVHDPFNDSQDCVVPGGIQPGAHCHYYFTFKPTATGLFTDTSDSGSNAGPFSIEVRGTGVGPALNVSPLSLDFGQVWVNNPSPQQAVTIKNVGASPLGGFAGGGLYPPFNAASDCNIPGGIQPGAHCHYYFTFTPTATGFFTATSGSGSNAGPFEIDVRGRGVNTIPLFARQWVTPLSLDFGPVPLGTTSATIPVTVTNTGARSLTNFAGGGVYAPFHGSQDCAGGVQPGHHCHFYYTFTPSATGVFTTTSNVSTNAGSFSIALRGSGAGASVWVTPLKLDFGPVAPGNTSPQQVVTITNTGVIPLKDFAGGGVYPPFSASQDCAAGVALGAHCHYYFTFTPSMLGIFKTTSNSSTNGGPFTIELVGGEPLFVFLPLLGK